LLAGLVPIDIGAGGGIVPRPGTENRQLFMLHGHDTASDPAPIRDNAPHRRRMMIHTGIKHHQISSEGRDGEKILRYVACFGIFLPSLPVFPACRPVELMPDSLEQASLLE